MAAAVSTGSAFASLPTAPLLGPAPTARQPHPQLGGSHPHPGHGQSAAALAGHPARKQRISRAAQRAVLHQVLGKLMRQPPPPPWWQAPLRQLCTLCLTAAALALVMLATKRLRKGRGPSAADARRRLEASMASSQSKRPQASNTASQVLAQMPPATVPTATPAPAAAPASFAPETKAATVQGAPAPDAAMTPQASVPTSTTRDQAPNETFEVPAVAPAPKSAAEAPAIAPTSTSVVGAPAVAPEPTPVAAAPAVVPTPTPVAKAPSVAHTPASAPAQKSPALPKARPPPSPKAAAPAAIPTGTSPVTPATAPAQPATAAHAGSAIGSTAFPGRKATAVQVDPVAPKVPAANIAAAVPKTTGPATVAVDAPVPEGLKVEATPDRGKVLVSIEAKQPGDLVFGEAPVLAVRQASEAPTLEELQKWLDSFAVLQARTRAAVLALCCPEEAALGGHLASVLGGSRGSKMSQILQIPDGVSSDDAWKFLRIMECNTFRVPLPDGFVRVELLLTTSRINHSCSPNALRGPSPTRDLEVEVRALRPISPGEELTIAYLPADTLMTPTPERRELLQRRWQFMCGCSRCSQPDTLRAFCCPAGPLCKERGVIFPTADGNELTACQKCGRCATPEQASKAFDGEAQLVESAERTERAAQAAAAELQEALEARDGPRFEAASKAAMQSLKDCASVALASAEVAPSHHLVARLAKSAASLRAMLGDGLAAGGKEKLSQDMWSRAAGELNGAMQSQEQCLALPRDGRIADLIGLSGLYQRLGNAMEARRCLLEAQKNMKLIYWACEPGQQESSREMQSGVEGAIAALEKACATAADAAPAATAAEPSAKSAAAVPAVVDAEEVAQ